MSVSSHNGTSASGIPSESGSPESRVPIDPTGEGTPLHGPASRPHCPGDHEAAGPLPHAVDEATKSRARRRSGQRRHDLREKLGLDYGEVRDLLGVPERSLRRMVATGRVRRSVLRIGKRGVRFLRDVLVDELTKEVR